MGPFGLLVGHSVHLLLGEAMFVDHVPAHRAHDGELPVTDGTARLAAVFLHVGVEVHLVVAGSTYAAGGAAVCGRRSGGENVRPETGGANHQLQDMFSV